MHTEQDQEEEEGEEEEEEEEEEEVEEEEEEEEERKASKARKSSQSCPLRKMPQETHPINLGGLTVPHVGQFQSSNRNEAQPARRSRFGGPRSTTRFP